MYNKQLQLPNLKVDPKVKDQNIRNTNTIEELQDKKRIPKSAHRLGILFCGEQYIISAKVHMDESTPHIHIVFVPVVHRKDKNGKLIDKIACSEYWKGKDSFIRIVNRFVKNFEKYFFNYRKLELCSRPMF